jgi:hypothetical protein
MKYRSSPRRPTRSLAALAGGFAALLLALVFLGCLSGSGSPQSGSETARCDLSFYPSGYDNACQVAIDQSCCNEERACAAQPMCIKLLSCINACPVPRTAACANTCTGDSGAPAAGFPEYAAIGNCLRGPTYRAPAVNCNYPVP